MVTTVTLPTGVAAPASLKRRLACMLYEGILLFGVLFAAALLYALATHQRHGLQGRSGLIAVLFLVLAAYFIGFWTHGGQTLAMKTWRIRLVEAPAEEGAATAGSRPVRPARALARYLAAWAWFLPPLVLLAGSGLHSAAAYVGVPMVWFALYAGLAMRQPRRQFWHDALCGTELADVRPA